MRLSEHFTLEEFTRNSRGFANIPQPEVAERLRWLCVFILEPIRTHFGKPIHITSGFRCPRLNEAVGGAPNSAHKAEGDKAACDFQIRELALQDVFAWIRLRSGLIFDTVILERGREERHELDDCIHIQINSLPRRRALLGATHGKSGYTPVEVK
ncbi:hypothetical protein LCGC14_1962350 [marine sediment metagenome]|uniref:Peptidase M15A C-terminal domain-containing protein n=1 Tax=marine sediment metagenome TaxID=412755 RepID=A0A0F9FE48_9ZZZZ